MKFDTTNIDAQHWLDKFCEVSGYKDDGLLLGYFCNYRFAISDPLDRKHNDLKAEVERLKNPWIPYDINNPLTKWPEPNDWYFTLNEEGDPAAQYWGEQNGWGDEGDPVLYAPIPDNTNTEDEQNNEGDLVDNSSPYSQSPEYEEATVNSPPIHSTTEEQS